MVRLVSAVRNSDSISAQKYARALLLPSDAGSPVDPFSCYQDVRSIMLSAKMSSELCDLLSMLYQTCISTGQNGPEGLFQDAISACVDCGRFLGAGGAVQLMNGNHLPIDLNVIQSIIERAVYLRRLDVLRPNEALGNGSVAQVISSPRVLMFLSALLSHELRTPTQLLFAACVRSDCDAPRSTRSTFLRERCLTNTANTLSSGLNLDLKVIKTESRWSEPSLSESHIHSQLACPVFRLV
jgi:hypothetical protein